MRGQAESARRRAWVKRKPGSDSANVPRPMYSMGSTNKLEIRAKVECTIPNRLSANAMIPVAAKG